MHIWYRKSLLERRDIEAKRMAELALIAQQEQEERTSASITNRELSARNAIQAEEAKNVQGLLNVQRSIIDAQKILNVHRPAKISYAGIRSKAPRLYDSSTGRPHAVAEIPQGAQPKLDPRSAFDKEAAKMLLKYRPAQKK